MERTPATPLRPRGPRRLRSAQPNPPILPPVGTGGRTVTSLWDRQHGQRRRERAVLLTLSSVAAPRGAATQFDRAGASPSLAVKRGVDRSAHPATPHLQAHLLCSGGRAAGGQSRCATPGYVPRRPLAPRQKSRSPRRGCVAVRWDGRRGVLAAASGARARRDKPRRAACVDPQARHPAPSGRTWRG